MPLHDRIIPSGPGRSSGLICLALALCALPSAPAPVWAQQGPAEPAPLAAPPQDVALPVLTLDFERLFETTRWGKRIISDLARDRAALRAENNRISDALVAEEKALTDRRATLAPGAFRAEADAFDERATGIRAAQKAKDQALTQGLAQHRQAFYAAVAPLMDELLARRGAVVLLDRRAIIRGLEAADITDDLAALVDARLGTGPEDDSGAAPEAGAEAAPAETPPDPDLPPRPAASSE
ncbi:OmpH family outer membrane protein [Rhodobacter lacus]|uniref:OmpH family outer membrane protein n=1 Tax=Rhodobacter lacus TaxID=1641972 RepID=A0ABW5ACA2_9RHOB